MCRSPWPVAAAAAAAALCLTKNKLIPGVHLRIILFIQLKSNIYTSVLCSLTTSYFDSCVVTDLILEPLDPVLPHNKRVKNNKKTVNAASCRNLDVAVSLLLLYFLLLGTSLFSHPPRRQSPKRSSE